MRTIVSLFAAAALSTALAQQPATDQDHAAHHPEGASAPAFASKKPPVKPRAQTVKPKTPAGAASGGMGMGMDGDMGKRHEQAHKPGGVHDQMHGKDGKMMGGGAMSAVPPAPAAK